MSEELSDKEMAQLNELFGESLAKTMIAEGLSMRPMSEVGMQVWNNTRIGGGLINSQKAFALSKYDNQYTQYPSPSTMFITNDDDPKEVAWWAKNHVNGDVFVRTCPLNPRHGVLESTRVENDADAIIAVVSELQEVMRKEDPKGCLVAQPYVNCVGSCVLAPDMYVVMGEGHDGITAGHGFRLALPLRANKSSRGFRHILEKMDLDVEKHEIEMVFESGLNDPEQLAWNTSPQEYVSATLTQIRGCDEHIQVTPPPKGVTINGAIPSGTVKATHVWSATGLEEVAWLEENVTKDKCPKGFVISEVEGSLLSHICAHARTHGIPYVIGTVTEGETWTEAASGWVVENSDGAFEACPYDPFEYIDAFRDGCAYSNAHWRRKHSYLSTFFHQWMGQPINDPEFTAFLAGVFAGWLVKATLAACLGEMRHASGMKRNKLPDIGVAVRAIIGRKMTFNIANHTSVLGSRKQYHTAMRNTLIDWDGAASVLNMCKKMFDTGWSSSYGGKKWGNGAGCGAKVASLIAQAMDADEATLAEIGPSLVEAVNALENAQHNNGALLNKFGSDTPRAFSCGTLGFLDDHLLMPFVTFMLVKDIQDDVLKDHTLAPESDWKEIGDWVLDKSKSSLFWKKNPMYSTTWKGTDMPEGIMTAIEDFRSDWDRALYWAHAKASHQYAQTGQDTFVPCGHPSCNKCTSHKHMLASPLVMEAVGSPITPEMDVWPIGDGEVTAVLVPRIINTLRAMVAAGKPVTIEEVVDAYAKAYTKGHMADAEKHLGKLLMTFGTNDFVAIMDSVTKLKQGGA